jgi:hypothetical protein
MGRMIGTAVAQLHGTNIRLIWRRSPMFPKQPRPSDASVDRPDSCSRTCIRRDVHVAGYRAFDRA